MPPENYSDARGAAPGDGGHQLGVVIKTFEAKRRRSQTKASKQGASKIEHSL